MALCTFLVLAGGGFGGCDSDPSSAMDAADEGHSSDDGDGTGGEGNDEGNGSGTGGGDDSGGGNADSGSASDGETEDTGDESDTGTGDSGTADDSADGGEAEHVIRVDVTLVPDADGTNVSFLTAAGSVVTKPIADIVGKPFYVSIFDGGFEQGVDLSRTDEWSTMPEDLHVTYESPPLFTSGPYDVSFIVYTETEITDEIKEQPFPPAPVAGELSAFTISQDQVKPGDPAFENGVVRVNVEAADATLTLENRHDLADLLGSFTDTVLVVP